MGLAATNVQRSWFLAAAVAASHGACAQVLQFSDRTAQAGLTAVNTVPPTTETALMLGGAGVGDFNNDGWQDVFVLGGPGAPDKLYINNHDGTFTDQAVAWGVAATHWGAGVAVGDFNNDGWLDIYVTSWGTDGLSSQHKLYRNNGNGTFTEVAAIAGVQTTVSSPFGPADGFGAAFGDYDLDGRLDLAVAGWVPMSGSNRLFHNNGDGTFTDTTTSLNLDMSNEHGYSPRFQDMNGDGYPELLWVGDFGTSVYFINNKNGTFTPATAAAGVGLDGNGMGQIVADFNNDGLPDWYVTSIYMPNSGLGYVPGTGNMLYINQGNHHFVETSAAAGVKQAGWAWGTVAADFRNMGRLDIAATNGWQEASYNGLFLSDPTVLFLNNGDGTFASDAATCGVLQNGQGRGMVTFDYDNDGRQDILILTNGGPMTLYHNDLTGPNTHYLRVFLSTRGSKGIAPNGYGAHVTLTTSSGSQHRWISGGSNYLSQSELSAHFGLGAATTATQLRVDWPNGTSTIQTNVIVDRTMTVRSCTADFNDDGQITVQDIFDFLTAWFAHSPQATVHGGPLGVQNIFDFLGDWFKKCG